MNDEKWFEGAEERLSSLREKLAATNEIPTDFVVFSPDWSVPVRYEMLRPDCWISRTWARKWDKPQEHTHDEVAKVYREADCVFLPECIKQEIR